jgi:signal transduction histidine kinase
VRVPPPHGDDGSWARLQPARWIRLLAATRLLGMAVAVLLLAVHEVSPRDPQLIVATLAWTAASLAVAVWLEPLTRHWAAWVVDGAVALGLVWLSTDWRSPFYVFALTTLILPGTALPLRRALTWSVVWTLSYLAVAVLTQRLGGETFQRAVRLEIVATHLMVPTIVVLALAYASGLLRELQRARSAGERLAVERERQRIAWELHDSAKQRVHAAHLLLSAVDGRLGGAHAPIVEQTLAELRAATADMDTSVAELRSPLERGTVSDLLRHRATELGRASTASIAVTGTLPPLPPLVATHAYRIAAEALINAVRHGRAERIDVVLGADPPTIVVRDDGVGFASDGAPRSHGLMSMRNRAEAIGARLELDSEDGGRGTAVMLELPTDLA